MYLFISYCHLYSSEIYLLCLGLGELWQSMIGCLGQRHRGLVLAPDIAMHYFSFVSKVRRPFSEAFQYLFWYPNHGTKHLTLDMSGTIRNYET